MPSEFTYRGFVIDLGADMAQPRGWFGVATIAGGDLGEEDEHLIRTPDSFAEVYDAFAAVQRLVREWIDQRK